MPGRRQRRAAVAGPAAEQPGLLAGCSAWRWRNSRSTSEAATAFRRVFELDPEDVWGRQNLAICLGKLGRQEDAIREFHRVLAIKPRFGLAWLGLGQLYEAAGRRQEAEECYARALANPIHRAAELTMLARFCQSRGWLEAARTELCRGHRA